MTLIYSWSLKKQYVVSKSSTELEYRALALATLEILWIQSLLTKLKLSMTAIPTMWCDNQGAIDLATNFIYHVKTKHIELDIHFIREKLHVEQMSISYVPSEN